MKYLTSNKIKSMQGLPGSENGPPGSLEHLQMLELGANRLRTIEGLEVTNFENTEKEKKTC